MSPLLGQIRRDRILHTSNSYSSPLSFRSLSRVGGAARTPPPPRKSL